MGGPKLESPKRKAVRLGSDGDFLPEVSKTRTAHEKEPNCRGVGSVLSFLYSSFLVVLQKKNVKPNVITSESLDGE